MHRRLSVATVAAFVYAATSVGITYWRGEVVNWVEVLLSTVLFAVVFYVVSTWLDRRRARRDNINNEKEN